MKKFFTLIFVLSFVFSFSSYAQLLQENFDYGTSDNADITTVSSSWTHHSGVAGPSYSSAGLSFNGYIASDIGGALSFTNGSSGVNDGDVNRVFSDSVSTDDTVFVAFLVELDTAKTGDYFFHLGPRTIGSTFRFRVFAKDSAGANGWLVGLSKSSGGTVYDTTILAYNKTYLVIGKYIFNTAAADNDDVTLYIYEDNVPQGMGIPVLTIGPLGTGTSGDPSDIGSVAIRQGTNTPTGKIDGIRVATSWFDVLNLISISQAREDLNSDLIPDRLADTVTVKGIVISPNYQTSHRSYYINDGTGGLATFRSGLTSPALNLGDEVWVNGTIDHYNGLTEIVPLTDTSVIVLSDSNAIPAPTILTIAQYKADPEAYEGFLVAFGCLNKVSGTWPSSTSATLKFSDGVDTIDIRIDSDTDIDNNTEPTYPIDIIGVGSQFTTYQILPRYYATDFLPCGTIPVELTSFSADISDGTVLLSWTTATEKNNRGFDIERSINNSNFTKIGFVDGNGTTTENKVYSFTDGNLGKAKEYYYRLKQIDFNGSFSYSKVVQVSTNLISTFELKQNYPNPFNPSTQISFALAQNGLVTLSVFNLIGQEVKTLINRNMEAGSHSITFVASGLPTGVYIYKLTAPGFTQTKKMMILK